MPVNPKLLKSYMAEVKEAEEPADYEESEESEGSGEFEHEAAEALEEAGVEDDYEGFLRAFYEAAPAIQEAASRVYVTALDALEDDVREEIASALDEMPEEVVAGIKTHLADLDADQLHEFVEELEEAGGIENDASVVAWLYWAARV